MRRTVLSIARVENDFKERTRESRRWLEGQIRTRLGGAGNLVTDITDPWGTRVEIVQRASLGPEVK